ncbi:hypothetical protein ACSBPQ_00150 [Stenotrophomonas sp. JC08]|uniref:hypothetical protein n=1 Tax=Stenotrophomonas sp. JC08 TaxID=3445779 RepID=UPI003FA23855
MTGNCCQTAASVAAECAVLVYRRRNAGEIRDIQLHPQTAAGWQPVQRVHADHWMMPACPVNGPSVTARDSDVWGRGTPRRTVSRSDAGGPWP